MRIRESEVELALNMVSLGGLQDQGVFRSRRRLDAGEITELTLDVRAGEFVRAMLGSLSCLASTDTIAQDIINADINILRSDIMNACAISTEDGPKIIVFSGLIKAIMFMLEFNMLVSVINKQKSSLIKICRLESNSLETMGYQAFTLLGHYAIWGTPLPRAYTTISRANRNGLVLELSKILWFLIMHELAHIKLRHLETVPAGVQGVNVLPALALDEGTNGLKMREFEADEYIIESLAPSIRHTFLSWILLPLQMFCSLERLLSNYRDTHPMAINRLNHLKSKAQGMGGDSFADAVDDIVAAQLEAQRAYTTSTRNMAFHSSHELARDSLLKLQKYAEYASLRENFDATSNVGKHAGIWDALTDHLGAHDGG